MELKSVNVEVKATPEGIIEAYASTFGTIPDSYGDIVRAGAFKKTIKERGPKGSKRIKVLYNHDHYSRMPIGTPLELLEDTEGLLTRTKMSRTQGGQDALVLAEEGALNEMSIGFDTIRSKYRDNDPNGVARELLEAKLYEYSVVPFPANEAAVILGVKSMSDLEHEIKKWCTIAEVGISSKGGSPFSGENAKRIVSQLKSLSDLLLRAEAASSTSGDGSERDEPQGDEQKTPPHSALLAALQGETKALQGSNGAKTLLTDLRNFASTLK